MDRLTCTLYELSPEEIDLIENRMLGFTEPVSDASEDETAGAKEKENKTAF